MRNIEVGLQSSAAWGAGSAGQGQVLFTGKGDRDRSYRIVVTGSNILLTLQTGSSDTHILREIQPPARFVCSGPVVVSAKVDDNALPAEARVMVGWAESGEPPEVGRVVTGPAILGSSSVGFRAFDACVLNVRGTAVVLAASQAVEIRGPATLTSGTGIVFYEP